MAMGVWQWGSGNGVWHWGSSDMRGMSVYGIGVATMGGGQVGYTPTPCVDAGALHQNRWPEKIRRCPTQKKMALKNTSDCVSQSVKKPQFLNMSKWENKKSVGCPTYFFWGSILPSYTYKLLGGLVGGGAHTHDPSPGWL